MGAWAYAGATADGTFTAGDAAYVSTLVFTTLALLQLGRVQAIRSFRDPAWKMNPLGNPTLVAMVAMAFALQMVAVYLPAGQPFFHTVALGAQGLAIGAGAAAVVLVAAEIEKMVWRRRGEDPAQPAEGAGGPG